MALRQVAATDSGSNLPQKAHRAPAGTTRPEKGSVQPTEIRHDDGKGVDESVSEDTGP